MELGILLFSFRRRINRAKYWLAILIYFIVFFVTSLIVFAGGLQSQGLINFVAAALLALIIISFIAVSAKRVHDRNKSAWWLLLFDVIPYLLVLGVTFTFSRRPVGQSLSPLFELLLGLVILTGWTILIWGFVEIGCLRGTVGANHYGPDPLGRKAPAISQAKMPLLRPANQRLFTLLFCVSLCGAFVVLFWVNIHINYLFCGRYLCNIEREFAGPVPGNRISQEHVVAVERSTAGDFAVTAQINGAGIAMVVDTGASFVVLTRDDAKAAGIPLEVLTYTVSIDTADGRTFAAPITLDSVTVGTLVERSIQALVAKPGQLKTSLLGMSFLSRLQSWEVRDERLVMRGYP
jgi:clan AA aspartic protease (TIGR02281 family)